MDKPTATNWQECISLLRQNVPGDRFVAWFEPLRFVSFQDRTLTIEVPNRFFAEFFDKNYAAYFLGAVVRCFGEGVRLQYTVPRQPAENAAEKPLINVPKPSKTGFVSPQQPLTRLPQLDPQLNPRYTFETFVEGASNRLSRSVGLSIAENPGRTTFNPFFLYGPSGVGKTHLANAIGVRIRENFPEKRVLFVSAHIFKTQYTDSVIRNTTNDFLNFYQTIDVLIIDDIQEITTSKTQLAFFHIFNHLQQNSRQIVITCDRPPALFSGIEERMLTRFKWGMVAEMEKPDSDLRRDILLSKMRRDGLSFPPEVISYIVCNVESSVRELEGVVNSIMAYSVVDNCEIDLDLTRRIVARAVNLEKKELSVETIIEAVCKRHGVRQKEILSKSRKQGIVMARQLAMYLVHKYTQTTYSQIGRIFGKRDHSTVLYACNQVSRRISVDKQFRREVEELESVLK